MKAFTKLLWRPWVAPFTGKNLALILFLASAPILAQNSTATIRHHNVGPAAFAAVGYTIMTTGVVAAAYNEKPDTPMSKMRIAAAVGALSTV
jgi:hypothetical protein